MNTYNDTSQAMIQIALERLIERGEVVLPDNPTFDEKLRISTKINNEIIRLNNSQMKQPNKIHEFDPLLYPTRLWVGVNIPFKDVCDKFYALNRDDSVTDFTDAVEQFGTSAVAACYIVRDKESGWRGIFCHIFRLKDLSVGVIAHEAEHVVCWICEQFGVCSNTFEDSEPRAYLIQYIANCINQVKTNKIEKK